MKKKLRNRLLQAVGLSIFTIVVIVPMEKSGNKWPRLMDQERVMEYAWREQVPAIAGKDTDADRPTASPAVASTPTEQPVAAVPKVKKPVSKRKTVAAAPAPVEEPEATVKPSHYMLRDRDVRREIAQMELEE